MRDFATDWHSMLVTNWVFGIYEQFAKKPSVIVWQGDQKWPTLNLCVKQRIQYAPPHLSLRCWNLLIKFAQFLGLWLYEQTFSKRCYWYYLLKSNSRKIWNSMKIVTIAPHHWYVQPSLASYITFGVGYCFIHAVGNARSLILG